MLFCAMQTKLQTVYRAGSLGNYLEKIRNELIFSREVAQGHYKTISKVRENTRSGNRCFKEVSYFTNMYLKCIENGKKYDD